MIGCLVLDRVLRRQFLFCLVWVWHYCDMVLEFLRVTLVVRGVVRACIRRIEFTTCEIIHPQEITACLSRQQMCDRYHGRPTGISIAYLLGSLSKWAGRFVYSSWCRFRIVLLGTRPKDTFILEVHDVSNSWARPTLIFQFWFSV